MRRVFCRCGIDNLYGARRAPTKSARGKARRGVSLGKAAAAALPVPCAASVEFAYTPVDAATISWGTPTAVATAGDNAVQTTGTLAYAFNVGSSNTAHTNASQNTQGVKADAINGVTFQPFDASYVDNGSTGSATHGNVTVSGIDPSFDGAGNYPDSNNTTITALTVSTAYADMLNQIVFSNGANLVLTLGGLTPGNQYSLQLFASDQRVGKTGPETVNDGVGDSSTNISYNTTNANGGTGDYIFGTFTASGPTQVVNFVGASPEFSGLSLFTPAPEPASLGLIGAGAMGLLLRRRLRTIQEHAE